MFFFYSGLAADCPISVAYYLPTRSYLDCCINICILTAVLWALRTSPNSLIESRTRDSPRLISNAKAPKNMLQAIYIGGPFLWKLKHTRHLRSLAFKMFHCFSEVANIHPCGPQRLPCLGEPADSNLSESVFLFFDFPGANGNNEPRCAKWKRERKEKEREKMLMQ